MQSQSKGAPAKQVAGEWLCQRTGKVFVCLRAMSLYCILTASLSLLMLFLVLSIGFAFA
jgi:hypothetical protein